MSKTLANFFNLPIRFEFLRAIELHELLAAVIGGVCDGDGWYSGYPIFVTFSQNLFKLSKFFNVFGI